MVIYVAELAFHPQNVEDLIDPDAKHWQLALVAEGHESVLMGELGRDRCSDLTFRDQFRSGTLAAGLAKVLPSQLCAFVQRKGKLGLAVLVP